MPYRLKTAETIDDGIRRVIGEQIERALNELDDNHLSQAETIHQVRKRCKKIRGALRLVRPGLAKKVYTRENRWYRDAARKISDVRDARAMLETFDALRARYAGEADKRTIQPIRSQLQQRERALTNNTDRIDVLLHEFRSAMLEGRKRLAGLSLEGDGFEAVLAGMRKTYARARSTMGDAFDKGTPEAFHEWRKRVKYHWYHMRLLREAWPEVICARRDEADQLADMLGDHHNLFVLRDLICNDPASFAKEETIKVFTGFIERRMNQIERESRAPGGRLFAGKPKHLGRRFGIYFKFWLE